MSAWFSEVDATNYILLISTLVIFGIFALLVFGSLPCTCSILRLLTLRCGRRSNRGSRVSDAGTSRIHVIGASLPDPESLYSFPSYPFPSNRPNAQVLVNGQPFTVVALTSPVERLPCYYELAQTHNKITLGKGWEDDELPPSYDDLYPTTKEASGGGKANHENDFVKD